MEKYLTTSVPSLAAAAVTRPGVNGAQQGIGMGHGSFGFAVVAARTTDDVVPGLPVWSPPA